VYESLYVRAQSIGCFVLRIAGAPPNYVVLCIDLYYVLRARVHVRSCDGYSIRELVRDMGCNVTHTGRYGNDVCACAGGAGEEE